MSSIQWNQYGLPVINGEPATKIPVIGTGLDALFKPNNVALIGATDRPNAVSRTILTNLISSPFGGGVFPINPTKKKILGIIAYPSIMNVPEHTDLAIICTPAKTVCSLVEDCGKAGVKGVIIISAGFKEVGKEGQALEDQILTIARKYGLRVVGPNCLGLMSSVTGLNASFAKSMCLKGHVGFISQSGALMTSVLDYSMKEGSGFSAFVSIGSMLDIDWGDLIYYLGNDPQTHGIVIYMESIGNARSFFSAAKVVARHKPIIVIKPGRSQAAAAAAASHTGSMTGSDDVLTAAFERVGVVRVDNIDEMFYMCDILDKQPNPTGPNLSIITNAGGPGVISTDAVVTNGGSLTQLSDEAKEKYNSFLPSAWSHGNPIDILGDAPPSTYAKSLEVAGSDSNSNGVLVILTPQSVTDPTGSAEELAKFAHIPGKPVIASWMGGDNLEKGRAILRKAGIPNVDFPDTACRLFDYLYKYVKMQNELHVQPKAPTFKTDKSKALEIIKHVYETGRDLLTEYESKQLLASYGIPVVKTVYAATADDAAKTAKELGFPVVVKLNSEYITHKSDVGGVELHLNSEDEVRNAFNTIKNNLDKLNLSAGFQGVTVQSMLDLGDGYELIVGANVDGQLGPVVVFGTGGILVEVYKDRALAIPPLNTALARKTIESTKICKALKGIRGKKPCNLEELEQILVRFSELIIEVPEIKELDINPLFATPDAITALDARVVLQKKDVAPASVSAIKAYPRDYVSTSGDYEIRPIKESDEDAMIEYEKGLPAASVKTYLGVEVPLEQRISHERMITLCHIDYSSNLSFVAINKAGKIESHATLYKIPFSDEATVLVSALPGKNLEDVMLKKLVEVAKAEKVVHVKAVVNAGNDSFSKLLTSNGFKVEGENAQLDL